MNCIQDLTFELDTELTGTAEYSTSLINGKIESIIISVIDGVLDVGFYFDEMRNICLLEKKQVKGDNYIPIRIDTISNDGQKFNFTQDKWVLNNKLYCLVEGNYNIKATITIRYSVELPE